jgi:uncharacterized membrane protein (DUF373 family)
MRRKKAHPLPGMMRWLRHFEVAVNVILLLMMTLIVTLSIVDLGSVILHVIVSPPYGRIEVTELVSLFSDFLLVLIGVELVETVRSYIQDKTIHVEVILAVGLVAITRKIIVLEPAHLDPLAMVGIAAIILALAVSFYLVHQTLRDMDDDDDEDDPSQAHKDRPT